MRHYIDTDVAGADPARRNTAQTAARTHDIEGAS